MRRKRRGKMTNMENIKQRLNVRITDVSETRKVGREATV